MGRRRRSGWSWPGGHETEATTEVQRAAQPAEKRGNAESEASRNPVRNVRGAAPHTTLSGMVVPDPGKEALL